MWTLEASFPNAYFGLRTWDGHVSAVGAMSIPGALRFFWLTIRGWSLVRFDSDTCIFQKVIVED